MLSVNALQSIGKCYRYDDESIWIASHYESSIPSVLVLVDAPAANWSIIMLLNNCTNRIRIHDLSMTRASLSQASLHCYHTSAFNLVRTPNRETILKTEIDWTTETKKWMREAILIGFQFTLWNQFWQQQQPEPLKIRYTLTAQLLTLS